MLKKTTTKPSRQLAFIVILWAVFVGIGIALAATWYQYQLSPDATSYFTIAQKYATGDLRHAINGYWSPFFSWLLVPFVWLHVNLIVAAKSLNVVAGSGILVTLYFYLKTLKVERIIIQVVCLTAAPVLMVWGVVEATTPDLWFAWWLVLFAVAFLKFMAEPTIRRAVLLGVVGALMYFTKSVGLFLFVGVVGLVGAWQMYRQRLQFAAVTRRYAPVFIVLGCLTLPFITLISIKYRHLTVNTGGAYNFSVVGPQMQWHQALGSGMYQPPNATAISAWEDPSTMTHLLPKWSPLQSGTYLHYYLVSIMGKNLVNFVEALYTFGPLLAAGILLFIVGSGGKAWRRQYRLFALISAFLVAGYTLLAFEPRYVWAIGVFGMISVGLFAQQLYNAKSITRTQILLAGVAIISVSAINLGMVFNNTKYTDRASYHVAISFEKYIPKGSHILTDAYNSASFACWNAHYICYGTLSPPTGDDTAYYQSLKATGITYYISYVGDNAQHRFTDKYATIVSSKPDAAIYKLK